MSIDRSGSPPNRRALLNCGSLPASRALVSGQQHTLHKTTMASIALFLLMLAAATSAAPVQQQRQVDENAISGQVKRADEFILYGNHQNLGRIKKSDPDVLSNTLSAVDEVIAPAGTDIISAGTDNTPATKQLKQPDDVGAPPEADEDDGGSTEIDNAALEDYLLNSYDDYYGERVKRSAPLTSDNMQDGVASKVSSRKRRDLTDAEIAALLEARQYEAAVEQEQPPRGEELGDLWRQELIDKYGPGEEQEEPLDQDVADSRTMLQYIYGENAEQPNDVSRDLEDEKVADIEPIYYHGRVGVFVPMKRSFISAVPGVRKRSGGYGSGDNLAYFDGYVERRRNEDEHERLYELAMALNAANAK